MNKKEFLERLQRLLKELPQKERSKYLAYYQEMIEDAVEDGCTEEQATARIGSPGAIAEEILSESRPADSPFSAGKKVLITVLLILGSPLWGTLALGGLLLAIGLLVAAALLVLSAYLLIWCIPLVTGAFSLSGLLLSVVSTVGALFLVFGNAPLGIFQFGIGIVCAGVFLLSGLITQMLCRYFTKITISFTRWLKNLFPRKKEAVA